MPNTLDHGKTFSPAVHRKLTDRASIERNRNNSDTEGASDGCAHSETDICSKPCRNGVGRVEEMFEMEDLTKSSGYSRQVDAASHYDVDDDESEQESFTGDCKESDSTHESFTLYTPEEERSVIKTFDRRIALFVALLYMLNFLDRSSKQSPSSS